MKVGVIGLGRFGMFHCLKYKNLVGAELVGVHDSNDLRCRQTSKQFDCKDYAIVADLLNNVEAISIVSPTVTHFEYAKKALLKGVHVFVEKPITTNVGEAQELVDLAKENELVLQVGHIERFNESFIRAEPRIINPIFISSLRTCKYNGRCRDVDVVLDLMIHDLDIILSYFGEWEKIEEVRGRKHFDDHLDEVYARLMFKKGHIAELQANRNSLTDDRLMSFNFKSEPPININFHQKSNDALMEEVIEFVNSIYKKRRPKVSGTDGLLALKAALAIQKGVGNV